MHLNIYAVVGVKPDPQARAEWEALQHALDYAPDLDRDLFDGMLSGGGMSCQLAWCLVMRMGLWVKRGW